MFQEIAVITIAALKITPEFGGINNNFVVL